jgi:hypothetical protein
MPHGSASHSHTLAILAAVVVGLFMIAAPFIGLGIAVLTGFWPFILGCAIGCNQVVKIGKIGVETRQFATGLSGIAVVLFDVLVHVGRREHLASPSPHNSTAVACETL